MNVGTQGAALTMAPFFKRASDSFPAELHFPKTDEAAMDRTLAWLTAKNQGGRIRGIDRKSDPMVFQFEAPDQVYDAIDQRIRSLSGNSESIASPTVKKEAFIQSSPPPKGIAKINRSHFGRGVRAGEEPERKQATRVALQRFLLPKDNIAQEVFDEYERFKSLSPVEQENYRKLAKEAYRGDTFGEREAQWLSRRVQEPSVNLAIEGVNEGKPIKIDYTRDVITGRDIIADGVALSGDEYNTARISTRQPKQSKFHTLAHELGHLVAGHVDKRSFLESAIEEFEAETIAAGVMNRMYPWHRDPFRWAASYIDEMDAPNKQFLSDLLNDPNESERYKEYLRKEYQETKGPSHLSNPEIQTLLNTAVQKLVPNPRQPFKNMIPDFWSSISTQRS